MASAVRFAELFCVLAALLHLSSIAIVALRARRASPRPLARSLARADVPGVSIVRPVCGLENNIEATLGSTFHLSWPRIEIVFCVESASDPIVPVVRRLLAEHPQANARLLVGDHRISINPKLNNVAKGWEDAAHDWIAMVDSNVLMPPDYVERLFACWRPDTGIVSAPPAGAAPDGLWSELECAFLNSYQARWQLAADALGFGFAHGKNLLMRRSVVARAGGIRALASEAAEDAAATKVMRGMGLRARLVPRPFPQPLGRRRLSEVWRRQLRWARLRRASFPLTFCPELLSGGFVPLIGVEFLVTAGAIPVGAALGSAALWYGAELLLARALGWPLSLRAPLLFVARDAMLPVLWVGAVCGARFTWKGNAMNVREARRAGALQFVEE